MKRNLKKLNLICFHFVNGEKTNGVHADIRGNVSDICGDVSDIWGNVSDICGDVSGICGNVSDIWGNVSGIRGDVSGIRGDFAACEITQAERDNGINVSDLVDVTKEAI